MSSLTNFAVGIVAARSFGAAQFGIFGLAWVTYGVVLNVSRGLTTDPLVVRFSSAPTARWREAVASATGTAALIGVLAGVMSVGVGLVVGGQLGTAFVALGVILPAVLMQDAWRYGFFAAKRGRDAFVNDLAWGVLLAPALLIAARFGTVEAFLLAWGVAGGLAALFGIAQARIWPRPGRAAAWFLEQRDLGLRYLAENLSASGAAQLRLYGLTAVAGLAAVGTVRSGELLMGPFLAVLMGLAMAAVPEAARLVGIAPHRLPRFCLFLGTGQALAAALWGTGLLTLVPDEAGRLVLADLWPLASALILPATLSVMGSSLSTGAATGLRALGAARRSLRAQLIASAAYVSGGVLGGAAGGAVGSVWGVAAATFFGACMWWVQFRAEVRLRANDEAGREMTTR